MFRKIWYPEMIQHHILSKHGKEPLNSYYYANAYPDVYAAAERTFGSWGKAIEAAGLNYNDIKKYQRWSKQKVVDEIRRLYEAGEPVSSKNAQDKFKSLYMASIKRFGNWGTAVQRAGINYESVRLRRCMSKEEIKKEVLELYRKGEDLAYPNMREKHQYLLAAAMKKLGNGSWAAARRHCGILTNFRLNAQQKRILNNNQPQKSNSK
ncbi:MAG: hypothetical protein PHV75_05415 [Victivallaceae bacterium]|nr:hypothetical protein [Victivallaceae bacterium]MDD3116612.1 hypothetical protein [Victivallaceae bacterium]MDD3703279.1 hypothetical protein [Victivallaceae bacterium]MDD4317937.1 hypothetical protein [Victivallaceae bacterium]NLK82909.1 hypothetical protein [Lentisphaerota bacterium]